MKSFKLILSLSAILALCSLAACKKSYQELNENPNGVAVAVPERLLNSAVYDVVQRNLNRYHRITSQLMQVSVTLSDAIEIQRYIIRPGESDYMWNNWYLQKTNFLDMYQMAEKSQHVTASASKAYMAMANILDAWVTSLLTDTYGDVPYFQANQGRTASVLTPAFDTQKDIYQDIFRKLEEANTLLSSIASNQYLNATQKGLDALYGSAATNVIELERWRKFGNSMYLRLLMRVSAKQEPIAAGKMPVEKIAEIAGNAGRYPVFVSNDESAIFRLTGDAYPFRSPFASFRDADFNGAASLSEFFINTLKEWGDPRLAIWATRYDNDYVGVPSGFPTGDIPPLRSAFASSLKLEPLLGNIMNYAELQFILAEAALKGYITADPKTYYDKGVQAAIEHWGLTMPANYLSSAAIVWNANGDPDQKMEQIHAQKYFTCFFTDFQQWFEYRRTGHPILQQGTGLANNGRMPARLYYPVLVQSVNRSNYLKALETNGPDNINTKVWWQQ